MDPMTSDSAGSNDAPGILAGNGKPSRDPTARGRYPTWGALRWLFLFRLLMVVSLTLVFSPTAVTPWVIEVDTHLAWNVLVVYALLVLVSGLGLSIHWPSRQSQVHLAIFTDLVTFTLLMHAAGGITSGLGILLAVSVAAGALLMEGRLSLLFAALASLAVMAQQSYSILQSDGPAPAFTQTGLLGILFFAVALLSHVLYRRVRAAEELAARRKVDIADLSKLNEFIIQTMGTGVLVADGERCLRLVNQAALDLLGVAETRAGAALADLSPGLANWLRIQVQATVPPMLGQTVCIGDREIKPSLKLLGDYRASGVVIFLRDNQEVIREAQQIKLASLGTLTASIAHNIRNPLSAISHASQLIAETPGLSADDRHLLDIIRRNSARIDETVSSVLQLSRRNQAKPQVIDLAAWLGEFCGDFREAHQLSEADLRLKIGPTPLLVEADPRHLHQIIANLCENALVHGRLEDEPARIQVRASHSDGLGQPQIEIIDAGPGIDEAMVGEIFNPFYTTNPSGTGLGLYIARELAETNGIRLQYSHGEPHGSCFRLSF